MKSLTITCSSCGALLSYSETEQILICEYCGTQIQNPHFVEEKTIPTEELLAKLCSECQFEDTSLSYGTPLTEGKHHDCARKYFGVPAEDRIYMVFDATIFGSCKEGLALCSSGIYFETSSFGGPSSLSWDEVAHTIVSYQPKDRSLYIGDYSFITGPKAGEELLKILQDLQENFDPSVNKKCIGTAEELLAKMCSERPFEDPFTSFGTPFTEGKKHDRARKHFKIPDKENVYMICDATFFGSCKQGFALCSSGLYFCESWKSITGFISWEDFPYTIMWYKQKQGFHIDSYYFSAGSEEMLKFLQDLQKRLKP